MTQIINFVFSLQLLAGIIIGVLFALLFSLIKNNQNLYFSFSWLSSLLKLKNNDKSSRDNERIACQSIKSNLNEMLDTLFSPENIKKSVSAKVRSSVKNGLLSDNEGQDIKNDVLEAHFKYMAFGETLSRTTYSNKQLINDYHNLIYRIIEKIDNSSLNSGT